MVVCVVVTVVIGVAVSVVVAVDVSVLVAVVDGVATWQSSKSPVWKSSIAAFKSAAPEQSSPLRSFTRPAPLHPKLAGFASPRV